MRWDMFKVIVERPRHGSRDRHRLRRGRSDARVREDSEDAPVRESMSMRFGTKHLNEHLGPLRRFLLAQVGRPWDRVRAEMCAHIKPDSAVQRHVLEHVAQMVVERVVLVDGRPVAPGSGLPYRAGRWRHVVYVCPVTGRLRRVPARPRARPLPARDRVLLRDGSQLQRIREVWYHVTFMPVATMPSERSGVVDAVLHLRLDVVEYRWMREQLAAQHGREDVYAIGKRQLGKRELARLLPEDLR